MRVSDERAKALATYCGRPDDRPKIIYDLLADREKMKVEIERLRAALTAIRDRGTGGRGASVVVSVTTLRKIAEQALAAEAAKGAEEKGGGDAKKHT